MKLQNDGISYKGLSSFIESRVFLNKALVDASVDVPTVVMANNPTERKERARRVSIGWLIAFASPFITLPLTNRLSLTGLTKNFASKENNIIQVSNRDLKTVEDTKKAVEALADKYKFSTSEILKKSGGWENLRKRLINSKCGVLAFDYLFTSGLLGSIGYFNNYLTRKNTGRKGFSAEFNMADSSVTDMRAKDYDKREKKMKLSFALLLASLAASPILIRNSLIKNSGKIKDFAHKFDYDDGILMRRLPMFLSMLCAYYGVASASRNETEMKDNLVRACVGGGAFFGGDILIGSLLARLSDKFLKTEILDKNCDKSFINKIIPPVKHLKDLDGKSRKIGTGLFWMNMLSLSAIIGFGVPAALNKMIKNDVEKSKK